MSLFLFRHGVHYHSAQESNKQSQNSIVKPSAQKQMSTLMVRENILSARDIEAILANIGVARPRASLPKIESMIQGAGLPRSNVYDDQQNTPMAANEMIDLIAQIRSM